MKSLLAIVTLSLALAVLPAAQAAVPCANNPPRDQLLEFSPGQYLAVFTSVDKATKLGLWSESNDQRHLQVLDCLEDPEDPGTAWYFADMAAVPLP